MDERLLQLDRAADDCIDILKIASADQNNVVVVDTYAYLSAVFAGISCAIAAKNEDVQELLSETCGDSPALFIANTDLGDFIFGEILNALLFGTAFSPFHTAKAVYQQLGRPMPDVTQQVTRIAGSIGSPALRVWNEQHSPYEEIKDAAESFLTIVQELGKTYSFEMFELPILFSRVLDKVLTECDDYYPAETDLPLMVTETFLIFGHFSL